MCSPLSARYGTIEMAAIISSIIILVLKTVAGDTVVLPTSQRRMPHTAYRNQKNDIVDHGPTDTASVETITSKVMSVLGECVTGQRWSSADNGRESR